MCVCMLKPLDFHGTILVFILTVLQNHTSACCRVKYLGGLHGEMTRTRYMTSDILTVENNKTVVCWLIPLSTSSLEDG